jgi:DNA-binding NarL/FixJ family response regulator
MSDALRALPSCEDTVGHTVIDLTEPWPVAPPRVLLAHEVRLFAEVLRVALADRAGFEVLPTIVSLDEAVRAARQVRPNVVIMGLESRTSDGLEVLRALRQALPDTAVLVVSTSTDVVSLTAAVAAGASGFLTMDAEMADLVEAVRATAAGKVVLSGRRLEAMVRHLGRQAAAPLGSQARLTERERDVLARLVEGQSTKAIAAALCVTPNTARTHIQNVLTKLGVHSRLEAAALVAREQRG